MDIKEGLTVGSGKDLNVGLETKDGLFQWPLVAASPPVIEDGLIRHAGLEWFETECGLRPQLTVDDGVEDEVLVLWAHAPHQRIVLTGLHLPGGEPTNDGSQFLAVTHGPHGVASLLRLRRGAMVILDRPKIAAPGERVIIAFLRWNGPELQAELTGMAP